jgi:hypothetical protein
VLVLRRLWHQLTIAIKEELDAPWLQAQPTAASRAPTLPLTCPPLQVDDSLVSFYENFIREFESKINPVEMTQFAVAASRKFAGANPPYPAPQCSTAESHCAQTTRPR